jgi:hypothetical protein
MIRGFLSRCLDGMQQYSPQNYLKLCTILNGVSISVQSETDRFSLACRLTGHRLLDSVEGADVNMRLSGRTLLAMLEGELGLLEAVRREHMFLAGSAANLGRLENALRCLTHGAARSPASSDLLTQFRQAVLHAER